ncbi:pyridoxamine 5'-phosphate oxidase family protein [Halorubrum sp. DTA98]|uniref:pyridoxamine 5'-phosphate oxidase family protein n=1 Tax=Halorubrum sp. DTA98 TaxID=3402163 RepID=UPI003AAF6C37
MSSSDKAPRSAVLGTEISETEIQDGLTRAEYGVLSLTNGNETYGIPLSFGYDETIETIYFMLAFDEGSKKREFLQTTRTASLTVVDTDLPDNWTSVLITGPVTPVPTDETTTAYAALADTAEFPAMYTFEEYFDMETTEQSLYQLTVESLSGRRSTPEEA